MNSEKSQILATNSIEKDQISVAASRRHATPDGVMRRSARKSAWSRRGGIAVFDLYQLGSIRSVSWCSGASEPSEQPAQIVNEVFVQLLRFCLMLPAILVASGALAADADNGKRLAEMRCVTCHIVSPSERRVVTDAPPFEAIARKFASNPDTLAFSIMDPHPRMNVALTRREAQDVAAYINTLAK
jgi:mono/diheme cytochrome c family protein